MAYAQNSNRGAKRRTEFYQGSSWSIGSVRDKGSTKEWTTQTALDYTAPPPVDTTTLLKTRVEGAARLRDLRQHTFVLGSRGASSVEETPVSRDIGNYRPDHIMYVKKSTQSSNYKGVLADPSEAASAFKEPPAWFKTTQQGQGIRSRPETAYSSGIQGEYKTIQDPNRGVQVNGYLQRASTSEVGNTNRAFTPAQFVYTETQRFESTNAPRSHDGMEFRKALIQSHWKIGRDNVAPDYRTSNQIAYAERVQPHPENRHGLFRRLR